MDIKDFYEESITIGCKVAFNLSGAIRRGVVVGIAKRNKQETIRYDNYRYIIIVKEEKTNKLSRITNTESIMLIPV